MRAAREVEKIDSQENETLRRLIEKYRNLIFSICLKLTGDYFAAEDLTQDTFIAAYMHLQDFDGQAEKAWLCRIASNKCIDYLRSAGRRVMPATEEEMPERESADHNEPLTLFLNREVMEELKACCKALPPPYRDIAWMHFVEGKKAKEIADRQGTNLKTIQTQIYRAKERLKKSYRKELLEK
ncbi:MAG: RNA polymerase sigma factor [Lachnospiraceae bacterium]|nr:RNA polymerase sigma factor [Lachnospiraceae bacterium]